MSPGWHSPDEVLPILFLALPVRVSIVRNCFVPPPRLGSPSFWTTWLALRAFFGRADALGHTGSLLECSEQEVLFLEGTQVMVKELPKACPFSKAESTQLNPRSLKEAAKSPRTKHLPNRSTARPVASERSHGPHGALHRTTTSQSLVWSRSQAVVGFRVSGRRWWSTSDNGKGQLSQDTSG